MDEVGLFVKGLVFPIEKHAWLPDDDVPDNIGTQTLVGSGDEGALIGRCGHAPAADENGEGLRSNAGDPVVR